MAARIYPHQIDALVDDLRAYPALPEPRTETHIDVQDLTEEEVQLVLNRRRENLICRLHNRGIVIAREVLPEGQGDAPPDRI
jgi:hypothetical protein